MKFIDIFIKQITKRSMQLVEQNVVFISIIQCITTNHNVPPVFIHRRRQLFYQRTDIKVSSKGFRVYQRSIEKVYFGRCVAISRTENGRMAIKKQHKLVIKSYNSVD